MLPEWTESDDNHMGLDERYKYLRKRQKRYRKASRKEKSQLLDEMEGITGLPPTTGVPRVIHATR